MFFSSFNFFFPGIIHGLQSYAAPCLFIVNMVWLVLCKIITPNLMECSEHICFTLSTDLKCLFLMLFKQVLG